MQEVLERANAPHALSVLVVWTDMLEGDSEEAALAACSLVSDSRAVHFHDPGSLAGRAVASSLGAPGEIAWDMYLFYDAPSAWENLPPRPVDWVHQLSPSWAEQSRYRWEATLVSSLRQMIQGLGG